MYNLCLVEGTQVEISGDELELYYCEKLIETIASGDLVPDLKFPYYDFLVKQAGEVIAYGTAFRRRPVTK